jgi:hypothetical protein
MDGRIDPTDQFKWQVPTCPTGFLMGNIDHKEKAPLPNLIEYFKGFLVDSEVADGKNVNCFSIKWLKRPNARKEHEAAMKELKTKDTTVAQQDCADKRQEDSLTDEDRRQAMKKLGKYAAYTAPVMLALLLPKKSLAESKESP